MNNIPYILYNEGGDHIRPFIVLPVPEHENWITNNIAYYRTSGESNVGSTHLKGTWIPTFGFGGMPDTTKIYKMSDTNKLLADILTQQRVRFSPRIPVDISNILTGYVNWCLTTTFDDSIMNILITRWSQNKSWNNVFKYQTIEKMLINYFLFTWQVIISRNIGGGIWDNTEDIDIMLFLKYLNEILGPRFPIALPDIEETTITRKNENQLVEFLKFHNAQSTYPMLWEYTQTLLLQPFPVLQSFTVYGNDYEKILFYNKKMKDYSTTHPVRGGKRKTTKKQKSKNKKQKTKIRKTINRKTINRKSRQSNNTI